MKILFAKRGLIYSLLLIIILIGPFYRGIDNQQFHADESVWYYFGARYFSIFFLHKDWNHPVWSKEEAFDQPQIGRYLIGFRLWLHGGEPLIRQIIKAPLYSFSHSRMWNSQNGRIPSAAMLRPGRTMMASFGLAGCLMIYCIGHYLIAPEAGLIAGLLLGLNPLMRMCSRRAMTDAPLLFFMAMMVLLMLALLYQYRRS
jgi:dolichyl-phosphate-mannose--protein O-mannosyl transferase